MKKIALLVMVAMLAVMSAPLGTTYAADDMRVTMMAENGSGQDGTAMVMDMGNGQVKVMIDIKTMAGMDATPQPAHIHKGNCGATLDPAPLYPLNNVVNGKSETMLNASMSDMKAMMGGLAINVHKSTSEPKIYVSCGNLMMMSGGAGMGAPMNVTMKAENGSGQNGTAMLTDMGNGQIKVMIDISAMAGMESTPQPAHIHKGNCGATLNPVPLYPLTNVVNGKSETMLTASMKDMMGMMEGLAINVHKSAAEAKVYVSCGNIMMMSTGGNTGGSMGEPMNVKMMAQNGSGQNGMAMLTDMGNGQIKVTLDISTMAGMESTAQPAHIHKGTCSALDPVPLYPLNNVVNGKSETMVSASMNEMMGMSSGLAINVHKSAAEASVYVSCGDILAMSTGGNTGGTPVGMPVTGNGDLSLMLLALSLLAMTSLGVGLRMVRNRA